MPLAVQAVTRRPPWRRSPGGNDLAADRMEIDSTRIADPVLLAQSSPTSRTTATGRPRQGVHGAAGHISEEAL